MKKDFKRLDGLLHEIRARCTGRDDRQLLKAILQEHLITLENEDLLEELDLDLPKIEIELEDIDLELDFKDIELEPFDPCPKRSKKDDQG
ncbi:MAG TPA: hypothetical protein PKK85_03710 [Methanobacteriaceae archaeon]|mgnify:CR=1 FL=1|nr:hypothetical protein [Methanobacteriaceae archaeon]